jgi:acetyl esterase/lipase
VVVVIHGGFWKPAYDLSLGRPLAASLADHGWAAWNIEYRRVLGGGVAPATCDDVAAAIDALADQDLDLSRVLALGHSAGGHLATWAASRARFPQWRSRVDLAGVVSQAGVLDLEAAYAEDLGSGAVEAFLGHRPGPADAPVDPKRQVPLDIPVHCIHGTDDADVPISQSREYVAAATAAGATARLTEIEGGDHYVVIDPASDAWRQALTILDGL